MMTSGDVAREFGVTQTTIKNWRDKGILIPEYHFPTGRFGYSEQQVEEFRKQSKGGR